jgi:hypothetical protein
MSKSMVEKLREFLDTEEGKKSIEEFGNKIKREEERKDRWIEKFKKLAESDIDAYLEKLIEKYDSDEYVRREYSLGYEPRESLLWIALGYAKKYCKECEDEKYLNTFTGEAYYIGSYVIQVMHGQGSVIKIEKIESDGKNSSL